MRDFHAPITKFVLAFKHCRVYRGPMSEYKNYIVTLRKQFPAWDEVNGIEFEVTAQSKADAIYSARRLASDAGHTGSNIGRYWFKAVEVEGSV